MSKKLERSIQNVSNDLVDSVLRRKGGPEWKLGFAITSLLVLVLLFSLVVLFAIGVGIWGINIPVAWGFAIANFVWWIGIGHAGTFISAILYLCNQEWRSSINRMAEAMTLFAVLCAALFPLIHLGRPWRVYWLLPYPNTMNLSPQFRSPLIWDEFAVGTYGTVSLLFWYLGLIPDVASLRDAASGRWKKRIYGVMALGWRGAARDWYQYFRAYGILAGLATPLVVSVHSIVSLDFAVAQLPGWHDTIFPPYFVAGAIFSGFAMVLTVCIPMRSIFRLHAYITDKHLNNMSKITLLTGLIVTYGYLSEWFMAWYSNDVFEKYVHINRLIGPYAGVTWLLLACNVFVPQLLWWRSIRTNAAVLFIISILINVGMWSERFMIVVTSLHRDFLPSSWGMYYPTIWDIATFVGTLGLFFWLILLFSRFLPVISAHEMKEMADE